MSGDFTRGSTGSKSLMSISGLMRSHRHIAQLFCGLTNRSNPCGGRSRLVSGYQWMIGCLKISSPYWLERILKAQQSSAHILGMAALACSPLVW